MNEASVLQFWFEELSPRQYFVREDAVDIAIKDRFSDVHAAAARCELYEWRKTSSGRLAEIIVLDQFSRNIYRDSPLAFQSDCLALALAQEAIGLGIDMQLDIKQRGFLYLPFMHSESLKIHEEALRLFSQEGLEMSYDFEVKHKDILDKFGRYPHRNEVLKRDSTSEEVEFLKTPESSF